MKIHTTLAALGLGLFALAAPTAAHAATYWYSCTPVRVDVTTTRVGVVCQQKHGGSIDRFNVDPSTHGAFSDRFLSVANGALLAGRELKILTDMNVTTGLPSGCGSSNCREASGIQVED